MRCTWLPDVLRAAGLTVVETPGWRGRGRDLDAIDGVVAHHTASPVNSTLATNLHVVTNGNAVAPGPIAQLMLWRDGVAYIIADGRANHAGKGGPWGVLPTDGANRRTIGIECVNNGVGEPWSADLVASLEIATAAILRYCDLGADRALMHSEWAPGRKIDPAGPNGGRIAYDSGAVQQRAMIWSGDAFRARVRGWLEPPPLPPTIPPIEEDDDMPAYLHLITPTRGEWLWTPGGEPQPLKSPSDAMAILGVVKATRVAVSDAQLVALQVERPA